MSQPPQLYRPVLALITVMATVALFYNMHLAAENPDYPGSQYSYGLIALIGALSGVQYATVRNRVRRRDDDEDQDR